MKAWLTRLFTGSTKSILSTLGGLIFSAALIFFINSLPLETSNKTEILSLSGFTMGTSYNIQLANAPENLDLALLSAKIQSKLDYLDKDLMSSFAENSQLSQFNRSAAGQNYPVAPELAEVLVSAMQIYELSEHAFDITVGPLVDLWGFGRNKGVVVPPQQSAIDAARALLGSDQLVVSTLPSSLYKNTLIELDLSAIAKGYAVDQISALLEALGCENFIVEIGGELLVKGKKAAEEPWKLGIELPSSQLTQQAWQNISSNGATLAIAGSGDYRNFFDFEGRRYSHEIDPFTGWPVSHDLASVTVISDRAVTADALATAFMVMGPEKAFALANREKIAAYFIMRTDSKLESRYTRAFADFISTSE